MARPAPKRGDIVWAELDPIRGSEQGGRRPALVISPLLYNERSSRVLVCPITSNVRGWTFEVPLPSSARTIGCVLVDQIRSVDRDARIFRHIEAAPESVVVDVMEKLFALIAP